MTDQIPALQEAIVFKLHAFRSLLAILGLAVPVVIAPAATPPADIARPFDSVVSPADRLTASTGYSADENSGGGERAGSGHATPDDGAGGPS